MVWGLGFRGKGFGGIGFRGTEDWVWGFGFVRGLVSRLRGFGLDSMDLMSGLFIGCVLNLILREYRERFDQASVGFRDPKP